MVNPKVIYSKATLNGLSRLYGYVCAFMYIYKTIITKEKEAINLRGSEVVT